MNKMNNVSRIKKYPVVVLLIVTLLLGVVAIPNSPKASSAKKKADYCFTLISGESVDFTEGLGNVTAVSTDNQSIVDITSKEEYYEGEKYVSVYTLTAGNSGSTFVFVKTKSKQYKYKVTVLERKGINISVVKTIDTGNERHPSLRYNNIIKVENQEGILLDCLEIGTIGASVKNVPPGGSAYCMVSWDHELTSEEVQSLGYEYIHLFKDYVQIFSKDVSNKLEITFDGVKVKITNKTKKEVTCVLYLIYGEEEGKLGNLFQESINVKKKKTVTQKISQLYASDRPNKPYEFLGANTTVPWGVQSVTKAVAPGWGHSTYELEYQTPGYEDRS